MLPPRTNSKPAWLAWTLCAIGIALALYGLALSLRAPGADLGALAIANQVLNAAFVVVFGAVGALIVGRQPRNTIGWLLMVIALSVAFASILLLSLGLNGAAPKEPTLPNLLAAWLNSWGWWLLIGPLLLIPLLFPTGRPPSPRWKWVIVLLAITFLVFFVFATFGEVLGDPAATPPLHNPIGFIPESIFLTILVPLQALLLGNAVLCVSAIFVRYRRAGPVERQQIKWLLLASGLFIVIDIGGGILSGSSAADYYSIVFDLGVLGIPLAIGVAILRYRLWDIDVIIRRTLVYAVMTALLAMAYFGSVVVLQNTFSALTGQRQSPLVTVLSTLVIAALFVPLRARVQAAIDRRFYRRKYDAARTLATFGSEVRDETNLEALTGRLLNAVDDALQPEAVGLWLNPEAVDVSQAQNPENR